MLNKLIDHHVHSDYSPDSKTSITDIIEQGIKLNLTGIMLTDHTDFDSPDPLFRNYINYDEYEKYLNSLRKIYPIEILMGIEIGYQPHLNEKINKLLKNHSFDFVICSIHVIDKLDFSQKEFLKNRSAKDMYKRYYKEVLYTVTNFDNYDVLGHLDFIIRYGIFKEYSLADYKEIIDKILETLIKKGKGLDVNTSGYRYGLGTIHPNIDILKRYKELGGKIITLGSDAHKAADLQANFTETITVLKEIGFTKITCFNNRKPYFINL